MLEDSDLSYRVAQKLGLDARQAARTIDLIDAGNTVPFIARYRKEVTGYLDEDQIRRLAACLQGLRKLERRRDTILASIGKQGAVTPELEQKLLQADTMAVLEDLYRPYKPRRRTRAWAAREKGLQGLADLVVSQPRTRDTIEQIVVPFLSQRVPTAEDALAGARDVVAQAISDNADIRRGIRERALKWATLVCTKVPDAVDARGVYQSYYDFAERVDRVRPHQVLAINRGEAQSQLRVHVEVAERDWKTVVYASFRPDPASPLAEQLALAIEDAARRLLIPAVERDVRRSMTECAEERAIGVFSANLRALLGQPPMPGHTVLGIDPGFRTGCKVAVVDPTGKTLDTGTIYPHAPQRQWEQALLALRGLVTSLRVTLIAVGNGTASRETEGLVAEAIRGLKTDSGDDVRYLMVSEAGASVYSASPLARAELPGMDVSIRGAVSIARRVQDPLAELVKIEPKSVGVGMYQHDVDQARLAAALSDVVESAVNSVGVDLNTASAALLSYVSGIGPALAARVVAYRDDSGGFEDRRELLSVPGLGEKRFEQCAGFLRIRDGDNPLDASAIHPESYSVAEAVLGRAGVTMDEPLEAREEALEELAGEAALSELAGEVNTGTPTLRDIFEELLRPGRDPRTDVPGPILRTDVLGIDDLQTEMRLKGTVRNVVDFGAFVDIGVKRDGLLHRSRVPVGKHLRVGDVIEVVVLSVEPERDRISLGWVET